MHRPILVFVAVACLVATVVWGRSARYLRKLQLRVEADFGPDNDATVLSRATFRKELHTSLLYGVQAADPAAVGGAALVLLLAGSVAAFVPARRASRTDPALVLRDQ